MQVCSGLWGKTIDMRRLFDLDMKAEDQVQPPRILMVTLLFPEFLFRFLEDFYSLPIMILYIPNDQRASSGIQLIAVSLSLQILETEHLLPSVFFMSSNTSALHLKLEHTQTHPQHTHTHHPQSTPPGRAVRYH